ALSNEYPRKVVLDEYAFVDSDKEPTLCNNVVTSNQRVVEPTLCNNVVTSNQRVAEPTLYNNVVTSNQRVAEPETKPKIEKVETKNVVNIVNKQEVSKKEIPKMEAPKSENKLAKQTAVLNSIKATNKIEPTLYNNVVMSNQKLA